MVLYHACHDLVLYDKTDVLAVCPSPGRQSKSKLVSVPLEWIKDLHDNLDLVFISSNWCTLAEFTDTPHSVQGHTWRLKILRIEFISVETINRYSWNLG